jgi:hypothetical protein
LGKIEAGAYQPERAQVLQRDFLEKKRNLGEPLHDQEIYEGIES